MWLRALHTALKTGDTVEVTAASTANALPTTREQHASREDLRELQYQVARLALLNQALWELLSERLGLTEEDLLRLALDIDLRDGIPDGKITHRAISCPQCGRTVNSKHQRCLYCGQLFEKQLFA
jgi:hypothetical protein